MGARAWRGSAGGQQEEQQEEKQEEQQEEQQLRQEDKAEGQQARQQEEQEEQEDEEEEERRKSSNLNLKSGKNKLRFITIFCFHGYQSVCAVRSESESSGKPTLRPRLNNWRPTRTELCNIWRNNSSWVKEVKKDGETVQK